MKETPLLTLLDRDLVAVQVKENFQDKVDLLIDVVDYGTNLIPRMFSSSQRRIKDIVIISVLLKHVVAMLDSIQILVTNGAVLAAHLPARSHFEACLYIDWILKENTEIRARQYYVWELREKRKWARKLVKGTKEHEEFSKTISKSYPTLKSKYQLLEKDAKSQISEIEKVLASDRFKEINDKFEDLEKNLRSSTVEWFRPNGPASIRDLASRVDRKAQYDLLYHQYSKVTHGMALSQHVNFEAQQAIFEPIRELKHVDSIMTIPLSLTFDVYRKMFSEYRQEELKEFSTKYVKEWRKRFLDIKSVIYNTSKAIT